MTGTPMNNTSNAVFIPTIVAQKALGALKGYLNLARTVARDSDLTTATFGQTIQVPKRATLSVNDKASGSEVSYQNPTATNVSVTLNKHKEVSLMIEDVNSVLNNQDVLAGYGEDAAIVLAEAIETEIAKLHPSVTSTVSFDGTSATTQENSFLKARERLVLNKVPKNAPLYAYLTPTLITKLLQVDRFSNAATYGRAGVIAEGALMRIGGIDIFESQLVQASSSPSTYHNLIYARNAFVLATRPLPVVGNQMGVQQTYINDPDINVAIRVTSSYDPKMLGMAITLDVLFGVAVMDTRLAVEFEST